MAEVWYTHCLREYPFPEFLGEKFWEKILFGYRCLKNIR